MGKGRKKTVFVRRLVQMTNHPVCQRLRRSLGHGTSDAKRGKSQENWERLVTLLVLVSRFLVQAAGPNQFHGDV